MIKYIALLLLPSLAFASGNDVDVRQSNDMNTASGNVVGGDTQSYGFSHALGDVDINDCMGSTQWGSIIVSKQKLVLNLWCAAEVYDAKGLRHMAAVLRCDIPEIIRHFEDAEHCIVANKVSAPKSIPSPGIEEAIYHEEQMAIQQSYDLRMDHLEQQIAKASKPPPARVTREVVQKPLLSDSQRMKLQAVLDEDEE